MFPYRGYRRFYPRNVRHVFSATCAAGLVDIHASSPHARNANAAGSRPMDSNWCVSSSRSRSAQMPRRDPAHGARPGAHHHRGGGDVVHIADLRMRPPGTSEPSVTPVAVNSTSPPARSVDAVFLLEIGDAELFRALVLLVLGCRAPDGPASGRRGSASPPPPARPRARRPNRYTDRCSNPRYWPNE